MTKSLIEDFLSAYRALDSKLQSRLGVEGYLAEADRVMPYLKKEHPDFENSIALLAKRHACYLALLAGKTSAFTVNEDDIDYLLDFARRLDEERDPISRLKIRQKTTNADAERFLPIETEAREVSRRVLHTKRRITIAACIAAVATVVTAVAIEIKKGQK